MVYGADLTGTLISVFPVTDQTVFQTQMTMKEEKYVKMETNTKLLPPVGNAGQTDYPGAGGQVMVARLAASGPSFRGIFA